jgi:hypothetical protein
MVDVTTLPDNAFGYVPTPALVAPIEFTMRRADYQHMGGHMDYVRPVSSIGQQGVVMKAVAWTDEHPWPLQPLNGKGAA